MNATTEYTVWYKSFWKVVAVIFLAFLLLGGLLFGWMVYQEYQRIQRGEASVFSNTNSGDVSTITTGTAGQNTSFSPDTDDDPYIGDLNAPVEIIAFEDYQCPYCKESYPIIQSIIEQYPEDIVFVYRDFPLSSIHPEAGEAALAAECADEQNEYWEYHDYLYANQDSLAVEGIYDELAKSVGLDATKFSVCVSSSRYAEEIQKDMDEGLLAGVTGTPTYFVNGIMYSGVLNENQWKTIIEAELANSGR